MTGIDELLEKVARAIFAAGEGAFPEETGPKTWEIASPSGRWVAYTLAVAAIEVMLSDVRETKCNREASASLEKEVALNTEWWRGYYAAKHKFYDASSTELYSALAALLHGYENNPTGFPDPTAASRARAALAKARGEPTT